MIISLCFAFAQGISDDKLLLVLLYQSAASAVMLVGNIFCCRKTYTSACRLPGPDTGSQRVMLARFVPGAAGLPFHSALPASAVAAAFAVQFLMASFFSYLLAVSASRFKDEDTMVWAPCAE